MKRSLPGGGAGGAGQAAATPTRGPTQGQAQAGFVSLKLVHFEAFHRGGVYKSQP